MKDEKVIKFGSPIWRAYTPPQRNAYEWAMDYKEDNENQRRSNRGGYQSIARSFDYLPPFYAEHIFKTLKILLKTESRGIDFQLGEWWLNVSKKGNFNRYHTHPRADLSGIWYITDNNNTLAFLDPLSHGRYALYKAFDDMGEGITVNAKAGEIVLFPSDLPHYVEPHPLDTLRVSVSFNMYLIN